MFNNMQRVKEKHGQGQVLQTQGNEKTQPVRSDGLPEDLHMQIEFHSSLQKNLLFILII